VKRQNALRRGTLTKHYIVSTKQGNSGTHVGLYDYKLFKKPKETLAKKILCYNTQYCVSALT